MMSLTPAEQNELARLLKKMEFPAPLPVFFAWCDTFGTVCAELAVVRERKGRKEILLTYREDGFFTGWHIPGCTHMPTETIGDTLRRVAEKELGNMAVEPEFFAWFERPKGRGAGESPRGHEFSFTYIAEGDFKETDIERFFPLDSLPPDALPVQIPIFDALRSKFA